MDPLTRLQNSLAGRYAVVREVGAGGMATVYLARDVKHDRHVALKVLRPELGAVLGVERFLSEIKVTANLQHPHLLPLFDSGEADGLLFYVMPYVEGESLRARLDREHQLPVDEAMRITLAAASALEYAHRAGVIHRDLKPENILLQHGEPVISDFGIALAVSNAGGARVTQTGLSLGTPQYMSPEQATGDRDVDGRSDIYSLAAVLYEMLTGEPPHQGKTAQAIIARVLTEKVNSVRVMRDTVPAHVDAALLKALAKLPADRFASAAEFSGALRNPSSAATATAVTGTRTTEASGFRHPWWSRARPVLPWALAAVGIGAAVLAYGSRTVTPPMVVKFRIPIPPSVGFGPANSPLAVSPDGSAIVVGSLVQNAGGLFVRPLGSTDLTPIPGTQGARWAFFSPDGSSIGFSTLAGLMRVPRTGGPAVTIAANASGAGRASWSERDEIVYVRSDTAGLWLVNADGGRPRRLTVPDSALDERLHRTPRFLPGGNAIVFSITSLDGSRRTLAAATLDGTVTRLGQEGSAPRYVNDGLLFFEDMAGTVLAAPFDPGKLAITGPPRPVLQGVFQQITGVGLWDVAPNGTMVQFGSAEAGLLVEVERSGAETPMLAEPGLFRRPSVSPAGDRVVVEVARGAGAPTPAGGTDLWMVDRADRTMSRFTFGETSMDPVWTRDGKRVAYARLARSTATYDIFWQPSDNSGAAEPLYEALGSQWPYGFTLDGKLLLDEAVERNPTRVSTVPVPVNGATATPLIESEYTNRLGQLSRDGKWIAYTSTESGRTDVYVRPYPSLNGKWAISASGGDQPRWNPNGRELFYRDGSRIVSVTIATSPTFTVLGRRPLFEDVYDRAGTLNWDVLPDGNRFVLIKPPQTSAQLLVTVNWPEELKQTVRKP